jgi:hypothetical protein
MSKRGASPAAGTHHWIPASNHPHDTEHLPPAPLVHSNDHHLTFTAPPKTAGHYIPMDQRAGHVAKINTKRKPKFEPKDTPTPPAPGRNPRFLHVTARTDSSSAYQKVMDEIRDSAAAGAGGANELERDDGLGTSPATLADTSSSATTAVNGAYRVRVQHTLSPCLALPGSLPLLNSERTAILSEVSYIVLHEFCALQLPREDECEQAGE